MKNLKSFIFSVITIALINCSAGGVKIEVKGKCGMCEKRIETAALAINGVKSADWDQEAQMLSLNFDDKKTNLLAIETAIAKVGHDTKDVKATDEAYAKLEGCCQYKGAPVANTQTMTEMKNVSVKGKCEMCKKRIEKAGKSINGVTKAEWSQESQILMVHFDNKKTNLLAIETAIAKVGHDTKDVKATDEVYNELAGCCQYRQ